MSKKEDTKQCYTCKEVLPLSSFNDTKNKHLLRMPALKGKRFSCIKCEEKMKKK
jgi:hypothetical protein